MTERQVGVILYGPPAAGKDTVTAALHRSAPQFEQYQRLKVGPGRTAGYRMGTEADLERLTESGQVVYANRRYSSVYVIDRPELEEHLASGIPVVHVGQPEAIDALATALPAARWVVVELWCPRPVAESRIEGRGTGDTAERLRAWDETPRLAQADLRIDTSQTAPEAAGSLIAVISQDSWKVVVPALHLVRTDGALDLEATRRYAEIASTTWVDRFLINGSTTRADQLSLHQRTAVLDIWANAVGPERVLACAWDPADLATSLDRGITPMVVLRGGTPDAVLQRLCSLPPHSTVYSHPGMFGKSLTPDLLERAARNGCLPVGGKLAKITLEQIAEIHIAAPAFQLWDGSSRHIGESLAAGADGVVATPLAAMLASEFPSRDLKSVQTSANHVQAELDRLPGRPERRAYLLREVRKNLDG
ncbi:hypothetical protein [Nocardia niigatensis]